MATNNPDRMRQARGLDALTSGNESPREVQTEGIEAPASGGVILGQLGKTFKKITSSEKEGTSVTLQQGQQSRTYAGYAAKANLLDQVQKTAGQIMAAEMPAEEGEAAEDLLLQQQAEASINNPSQQQQQAAARKQQEQLQQQQQLIEEKKQRQREMERRKRRQAMLTKDSLIKKTVKEGLEPLDAGLLPTPFGPVWACYRIYKWFQS